MRIELDSLLPHVFFFLSAKTECGGFGFRGPAASLSETLGKGNRHAIILWTTRQPNLRFPSLNRLIPHISTTLLANVVTRDEMRSGHQIL